MQEYENKIPISVKRLKEILEECDDEAIVLNGKEKNIRIYPGRDAKTGKTILMIC